MAVIEVFWYIPIIAHHVVCYKHVVLGSKSSHQKGKHVSDAWICHDKLHFQFAAHILETHRTKRANLNRSKAVMKKHPPHPESLHYTTSGLLPSRWKTVEINWVSLSHNASRKQVGMYLTMCSRVGWSWFRRLLDLLAWKLIARVGISEWVLPYWCVDVDVAFGWIPTTRRTAGRFQACSTIAAADRK